MINLEFTLIHEKKKTSLKKLHTAQFHLHALAGNVKKWGKISECLGLGESGRLTMWSSGEY